jgi:NAD+ kinase
MTKIPNRFLVFHNPQVTRSQQIADEINGRLQDKLGLVSTTMLISELDHDPNYNADMLLAVGGDGTMLRVGRVAAQMGCPVLGINLGEVGFLPQIPENDWQYAIDRILKGDFELEPRMLVHGELIRDGNQLIEQHALNEIVVTRGALARPIRLETQVDDAVLANYVADGVIVSTPTGSTAYSLAAGGPILPPNLRNLVVTPIAPHLSMGSSVVLSEGCTVTITIRTNYDAILSLDGQLETIVMDGDCVRVRASNRNCNFVRLQDPNYFYSDLSERMSIKGREHK